MFAWVELGTSRPDEGRSCAELSRKSRADVRYTGCGRARRSLTVLVRGRAVEADLSTDEARGATGMTAAHARACRRGSSARGASVLH